MTPSEVLKKIEQLKKEADALQPVNPEAGQRLWKKFRLEWNYNSNHIEGNTLTYGETELLLIFDKTTGNHDKREYDEMQAHDVAIKMVQELAEDHERPLTESFIRKLNEIILVKPYWKEAITPDGQATRREIKIGEYKTFANSVRLQNGEMFNYATPEETPALMHDLMKWHNANGNLHPVELAALFHYKFVRIHPFDDGNGRVARLVMNYILMKAEYPPVIIKSKDKANYLTALNKADIGDTNAFIHYVAEQLVWSMEISNKAARGESIAEDGDLDKQVAMLDRMLDGYGDEIKELKSDEVMKKMYKTLIQPLFFTTYKKLIKISQLFSKAKFGYFINSSGSSFTDINKLMESFQSTWDKDERNVREVTFDIEFSKVKKLGHDAFDLRDRFKLTFEEHRYQVEMRPKQIENRFYHQLPTEKEINEWADKFAQDMFTGVEQRIADIKRKA